MTWWRDGKYGVVGAGYLRGSKPVSVSVVVRAVRLEGVVGGGRGV